MFEEFTNESIAFDDVIYDNMSALKRLEQIVKDIVDGNSSKYRAVYTKKNIFLNYVKIINNLEMCLFWVKDAFRGQRLVDKDLHGIATGVDTLLKEMKSNIGNLWEILEDTDRWSELAEHLSKITAYGTKSLCYEIRIHASIMNHVLPDACSYYTSDINYDDCIGDKVSSLVAADKKYSIFYQNNSKTNYHISALYSLMDAFPKSDFYISKVENGLTEQDRKIIIDPQYKSRVIKTITGSIDKTKISRNAFDIVIASLCNVQTDFTARNNLSRLVQTAAIDGLVVVSMHLKDMDYNIMQYLAENLEDIQFSIYRSPYRILVIGKRKRREFVNYNNVVNLYKKFYADFDNSVDKIRTYDSDVLVTDIMRNTGHFTNKYVISDRNKEVETFYGSDIDLIELENYIENNNYIEKFIAHSEQSTAKKEYHPLLPFNIGQLGLITTSGCIDGTIASNTNAAHVIKGRTIRKKIIKTVLEKQGDKTLKSEETDTNRVEISYFLPNGSYKVLVD